MSFYYDTRESRIKKEFRENLEIQGTERFLTDDAASSAIMTRTTLDSG
jgi:hypothetical protein